MNSPDADLLPLLPHPDSQHLESLQGWLGLGALKEARAELNQLSPSAFEQPIGYSMHCALCAKERNWNIMYEVAKRFTNRFPDCSEAWLYTFYALNGMHRYGEARTTLLPVADKFKDEWQIPYNLARLSCKLWHPEEAKPWLEKATKLNPKARSLALEDRDFEPLWPQIREA